MAPRPPWKLHDRRHAAEEGWRLLFPTVRVVLPDGFSSLSSIRLFGSQSTGNDDDPAANAAATSSSAAATMDVASLFKNPIVQQLWTARQEAKRRRRLPGGTRDVDGIPEERTPDMSDVSSTGKPPEASRVEVSYPFSTDPYLQEAYKNPWGQMRFGRLMEDLDALAGNVAFFHVDDGVRSEDEQPIIVTASVDRIRLRERPDVRLDQRLSGQVTWTGTSSMEIKMRCRSEGSETPWLEAYVTFVTLDRRTKKPTAIPAIVPQTAEERAEFEAGVVRAARKKERRKHQQGSYPESVLDAAKSLLEQAGPLLNMPSLADPHSILMSATKMQNAMIAQPQFQNLASRVFGGFLVRRAFELAFANAYVFGGAKPIFLEVDEVAFASPVDVGDLLVFNSRILYTDRGYLRDYYEQSGGGSGDDNGELDDACEEVPLIHVEVEAWVTVPEEASAKLSNQFYFTFAGSARTSSKVRTVLPANIDEARRMAARMAGDQQQGETYD